MIDSLALIEAESFFWLFRQKKIKRTAGTRTINNPNPFATKSD